MLLWIPTSPASGMDEDEKGEKLRRRARKRVKNFLLFLGILFILCALSIAQINYTRERSNSATMVRSRNVKKHEHFERNDDFFGQQPQQGYQQELPENSIYRLSFEDPFGETVNLDRFSGMVTLIVNTACK